jgi:peptidoglycan/xylan/chitin deacetylase (PgdA/CDA1 family)
LTFDDGFSSDYDIVLPELKKAGAKATFFIVTDLIGKPGYMTKEQIKSLSEAGMQIGSHSVSHPNFLEINPEEREKEFIESKLILERIIDKEITCFSFPFGFYNFESIETAFSAGYSICCTSDHGLSSHDQTVICRNSINANTSIERVGNVLEANLLQRTVWFLEDKTKSLMKKFMPDIYVYMRNLLSRF